MRVLVVDDDEHVRRLVSATFAAPGDAVREAADGRAALEAARRERPDVVLLDLAMPELDGIEVCRRLKSEPVYGDPVVVAVTASAGPETRALALAAGADAFVTKPFSPVELAGLVAGLARGHA